MNDGPTHLSSAAALPNEGKRARRRARSRTSLFAQGEPMIWLTGGGLAIAVCMIVGLLGLIAAQGLSTFWPGALREVRAADGRVLLGEVTRRESIRATHDSEERRRMFRTGNFELTGEHFVWVRDSDVVSERLPEWAMLIERASWGRFYGNLAGFQGPGEDHGESPAEAWAAFQRTMPEVARRRARQNRLEVRDLGEINRNIENARLDVRRAEMKFGADSAEHRSARERQQSLQDAAKVDYERIRAEIRELNECNGQYALRLVTADGTEKILPLAEIVRAVPANQLNRWGRVRVYISRWLEFLRDDPREANSEGGVFPAIFGTVVMTLVMSLAVSPFGVMAALYLREYAGGGPFVSAVRISINNLAGVPSIVFGVFGLGFFCYFAGAGLDSLLF
nr:phosphate ABC transporter, permease protein PstA [Kiritimatiellia bacterium]